MPAGSKAEGWFDPEVRANSWFMSEVSRDGWWDKTLLDEPAAAPRRRAMIIVT
jgi:hypothetical protein